MTLTVNLTGIALMGLIVWWFWVAPNRPRPQKVEIRTDQARNRRP